MSNYILTESEHFQTIVINANSARYKAKYFFDLAEFVEGKITDSTFKRTVETFLIVAGENNPNAVIAGASTIVGVLNNFVPSKKATVKTNCERAANMFVKLRNSIEDSAYPKWEVKLIIKRYKTNDGSHIDVPVGHTVTGYYTPTGEKLTW